MEFGLVRGAKVGTVVLWQVYHLVDEVTAWNKQGFSSLFKVNGKEVNESYLDYLWNLLMRPMGDVDRIDTLGVISVYYIMCDAPIKDKVGVIDQLYIYIYIWLL